MNFPQITETKVKVFDLCKNYSDNGDDSKDLVFTRESLTVLSYPCMTSIAGMIKNA